MTVTIQFRLSGGAANSDPNAALGGAMSSTAVSTAVNGLWDDVLGDEAADGDTEYRCIYVRNNGTTTALNARIWVSGETPSPGTAMALALGGEGKGGTAETVANESSAPSGEVFTASATVGAALVLGDLAQNEFFPVWVRRTVGAATAGLASDTFEFRVDFDFIPA